jgi:cytochrome c
MDTFEINKIVACILIVALIFIGLANLGEILYEVEKPEIAHYQVEDLGDSLTTASETHEDTSTPIEVEDSIFTLLASADLSKGAKVFKKCSQCHVAEKDGANKIGPALWDIVNKEIGSKEDFKYSNALASYERKWTYEELNGFLKNPKKYIEGTKMSFVGLKKSSDRANVILYLRSFSDNPVPIE